MKENEIQQNEFAELLDLNQVVNTFIDADINLITCSNDSFTEFDGVAPAAFTIAGTDEILLVYVFKSIPERIEIFNQFHFTQPQKDFFPESSFFHNAKNTEIIHIPTELNNMEYEEMESVFARLRLISNIVWEKLNDTQKIKFIGDSEFWEGIYEVESYYHRYETQEGRWGGDKWHKAKLSLKPKFDLQDRLQLNYKVSSISGSTSGDTAIRENKFYCVAQTGGNRLIFDKTVTVTVEWDGKKDVFELRAEE